MPESSLIPESRLHAPAGVSLASLQAKAKRTAAPALPDGISQDLGRILRPQAAYRWLLPQLAAITPQYIEMVLRGALAGSHVQAWELFDLMEDSWPRLAKNLNEVKRAVQNLDWKIVPWQEEDTPPTPSANEKMSLVSNAIWRMRPDPAADENAFRATIYDILDAWGKGTAVLEVDWENRNAGKLGSIIAPRATFWAHPTTYAWAANGRLGLRTELGIQGQKNGSPAAWPNTTWSPTSFNPMPGSVTEFPPDKFLLAINKFKSGTPLGGALLRPLAWWWCAQNFSADWLLNLAQLFGLPFRWANYATGSAQGTVDAICNMLANLGSAGWAAFPEGVDLKYVDAGKTGENSPQADVMDRADKQCDLMILGQTLTTDVSKQGGSRALGDVHMSVRDEIIQAAGSFAAEIINQQLIPSILRLNYGENGTDEAPEFRPEPHEEADMTANAQRDVLLQPFVQFPKKWFYKRHDIPLPQDGEETVGGTPTATEPQPGEGPLPGEEPKPGEATPAPEPATKAKQTPGSPTDTFERNARADLSMAILADFDTLNQRLLAIGKITDPAMQRQKLAAFLQDLNQLGSDLAHDPDIARIISNILAAGFANGMAAKPKTP